MNTPVCRPLMDAASPQCRCPQCSKVRALRLHFPTIRALHLSPDKHQMVFVTESDSGCELWTGKCDPLFLDRVWVVGEREALLPPLFSPDGSLICIPLLGPFPGLHLVHAGTRRGEGPHRITDGHDFDPRWLDHARQISYYRVSGTGMTRLFVRVPLLIARRGIDATKRGRGCRAEVGSAQDNPRAPVPGTRGARSNPSGPKPNG